jgi:DNA polymerase I-like protein with 3'-5' exonuclease and polymerase domains
LAVDIETRGGHTACICLASSERRAISIPLMCVENPYGYFSPQQEVVVHRLLRSILTSNSFEIVGQNYSYDMQYLRDLLLITPKIDRDTMVMQHLAWPGVPASLAYIASIYNRYYRYWKDDGKDWVEGIPEEQLWEYNCVDGVHTLEASYHLERVLRQLNLHHFIEEEMDVLRLQFEMMTFGVAIDRRARDEMANDLQLELDEMEDYFEAVLNPAILPELQGKNKSKNMWYSSPAQLGRLFYDILGIKEKINRDTGSRKVDDDALQQMKVEEPLLRPLLNKLQDYRSTGIFYNNVTSALEPDGRMRTQYTQMPNTFRWASRKNVYGRGMNTQNIPKGQED